MIKDFNNHLKTCQRIIGVNLSIFLQGEAENAELHGEKITNELIISVKLHLLRTSLLKKSLS